MALRARIRMTSMLSQNLWLLLIPLAALLALVLGAFGVMKLQKLSNAKMAGADRASHVLHVGTPTTARVLMSTDTKTRIDRIFILTRLRLQVAAVGQLPDFESEVVVPLSPVKLAEFSPGRIIRVKVDPSTREVAIDELKL